MKSLAKYYFFLLLFSLSIAHAHPYVDAVNIPARSYHSVENAYVVWRKVDREAYAIVCNIPHGFVACTDKNVPPGIVCWKIVEMTGLMVGRESKSICRVLEEYEEFITIIVEP